MIRKIFTLPNAEIELFNNYFSNEKADEYYNYLSEHAKWKRETMNLYGKEVPYARLMAWYGDPDKKYRFSGKTQNPNNWNNEKILLEIKEELEGEYNDILNSVLLNKYRNERDSISWHSDDEKELGEEPSIYSLSLGCKRIFKLKRKDKQPFPDPDTSQTSMFDHENKVITTINIPLEHNSLLIMRGETQKYWLHSIDKVESKVRLKELKDDNYDSRINLTFRRIFNEF
tara:strand:- start:1579 stop:2265 length:687 start_codon:yes stop_codon:yes gene_type:complete